jgi:hypothetical protein
MPVSEISWRDRYKVNVSNSGKSTTEEEEKTPPLRTEGPIEP